MVAVGTLVAHDLRKLCCGIGPNVVGGGFARGHPRCHVGNGPSQIEVGRDIVNHGIELGRLDSRIRDGNCPCWPAVYS